MENTFSLVLDSHCPSSVTEAVLAEAAFHLGDSRIVLGMLNDRFIELSFDCNDHLPHLKALAERYADRKPDLAPSRMEHKACGLFPRTRNSFVWHLRRPNVRGHWLHLFPPAGPTRYVQCFSRTRKESVIGPCGFIILRLALSLRTTESAPTLPDVIGRTQETQEPDLQAISLLLLRPERLRILAARQRPQL